MGITLEFPQLPAPCGTVSFKKNKGLLFTCYYYLLNYVRGKKVAIDFGNGRFCFHRFSFDFGCSIRRCSSFHPIRSDWENMSLN